MTRGHELTNRVDLSPEQQGVYDNITATRGAVRGVFAILLHRADVASAVAELGACLRFRSTLDAVVRSQLSLPAPAYLTVSTSGACIARLQSASV